MVLSSMKKGRDRRFFCPHNIISLPLDSSLNQRGELRNDKHREHARVAP